MAGAPAPAKMRILFLSAHFPGLFGSLASLIAADAGNSVIFASDRQQKGFSIPGCRLVRLRNMAASGPDPQDIWLQSLRNGERTRRALISLRENWGEPDIVFSCCANGQAFYLADAFPDSFQAAYADSGQKNFSLLPRPAREAIILIQCVRFMQAQVCFALSQAQKELFPSALRNRLNVVCDATLAESHLRQVLEARGAWLAAHA